MASVSLWLPRVMFWSASYLACVVYAISRKVVGIKAPMQSARDKTERWSGYSIEFLHIGLEERYKFGFLHMKNLFFLAGDLYLWLYVCCRMSLSYENSSKIQRG